MRNNMVTAKDSLGIKDTENAHDSEKQNKSHTAGNELFQLNGNGNAVQIDAALKARRKVGRYLCQQIAAKLLLLFPRFVQLQTQDQAKGQYHQIMEGDGMKVHKAFEILFLQSNLVLNHDIY